MKDQMTLIYLRAEEKVIKSKLESLRIRAKVGAGTQSGELAKRMIQYWKGELEEIKREKKAIQ